MKKTFILSACAAVAIAALTACSGNGKSDPSIVDTTVADNANVGVTADIDAGFDPNATLDDKQVGMDEATDADDAKTLAKEAAVAAQPKGVVVLDNDEAYRPGQKVSRLTILDFNAVWCGPCKQFAPAFDEAAKHFGANVDFVSVDVDNNPNTANAFGVQSIPTVIFLYPNGKSKAYVGTGDLLPASKFISLVQGAI